MEDHFYDRHDAGRKLAKSLEQYGGRDDVIVLALPRGGVPVGYEVAKALAAELDVLTVRKLGVPHHPELAMGAIASGGAEYINTFVVETSGVSQWQINAARAIEQEEMQRREKLYRGNRPRPNLEDKIVILVDDGMATGSTMQAAIMALRSKKPKQIIVAVPVAPGEGASAFMDIVDGFVCLHRPATFMSVGQFYTVFDQTSDQEVRQLLAEHHKETAHVRG
ncbi:MAG TPA: phosphoribosyltransferase [Gammaproteobacteria bacterium]|nr:phosphoribosyltransferase [Gammaproteobacteria bacterium]